VSNTTHHSCFHPVVVVVVREHFMLVVTLAVVHAQCTRAARSAAGYRQTRIPRVLTALHTSTSSGAPLSKNSSANVRTDASDPRSSTAGSARPPRVAWGITADTASCAFSTLRHAMITTP